jgi:nitrogen regulatory protein PII
MKLIVAYIQPFMADRVSDALRAAGVHGVSIVPCHGFGRVAEDKAPRYAGQADALGVAAKTKFEIVCCDSDTDTIVATIRQQAHTGHHGDGKIFVSDVGAAVDIRTGDTGENVV